jgi:hypothetical protein
MAYPPIISSRICSEINGAQCRLYAQPGYVLCVALKGLMVCVKVVKYSVSGLQYEFFIMFSMCSLKVQQYATHIFLSIYKILSWESQLIQHDTGWSFKSLIHSFWWWHYIVIGCFDSILKKLPILCYVCDLWVPFVSNTFAVLVYWYTSIWEIVV